jgi:hypothetical protein
MEFSWPIFEKYSYETSWKFVQWEPSCSMRTDRRTDGRTDRHDEANSCFCKFCKRDQKNKQVLSTIVLMLDVIISTAALLALPSNGTRDSLPVCARTRSYRYAFPYCGTVSHPYFPSAHRGQRRYHVKILTKINLMLLGSTHLFDTQHTPLFLPCPFGVGYCL